MSNRLPQGAGDVYGQLLAYLDAPTLAAWSEASGLKLLLSRFYARVFGYPELAAHRRFRPIREALHRHGGSRVLDLGAGNGLYSLADGIGRAGSVHVLADLSFRHLRRAAATGTALGLAISGVACSAEALPLTSASVDTVLLIEVLQFVDHDEAAIKEIARVLRPGGVWLCEQDRAPPGAALVQTGEPRLRKRRVGYTTAELAGLAARAGLVLEGSQMVSGRASRWWESLDGRIFRRSRLLHYAVFPFVRLLAWASTPAKPEGGPGTVLYRFRKPESGTLGTPVVAREGQAST